MNKIDKLLQLAPFLVEDEKTTDERGQQSSKLLERYVGKYVIVRSYNEGVNSGYVVAADETGIILKDARRLYKHRPKNTNESWYEGVANSGISDDSKISSPVIEKAIVEKYSITICSEEGKNSLIKAASNVQN